jgi:hypothetical protein
MDLEWLLRHNSEWRQTLKRVLFTTGDIVQAGEKAEQAVD